MAKLSNSVTDGLFILHVPCSMSIGIVIRKRTEFRPWSILFQIDYNLRPPHLPRVTLLNIVNAMTAAAVAVAVVVVSNTSKGLKKR